MQSGDLSLDDATFRATFDRDSKTYHNGDSREVNVGEKRKPEGVSELPEEGQQPAPVVVDYGAEYDSLMNERKQLELLKKTINKVNASIGVMLANLTDTKRVESRDAAVAELKAFHTHFPEDSEWGAHITEIAAAATADADTLSKGISSLATPVTRAIMKRNKEGLARIKAIKKEAIAKAKEAASA